MLDTDRGQTAVGYSGYLVAVGEYIGPFSLSVTIGFLLLYLIKGRKIMRQSPTTDITLILWIFG